MELYILIGLITIVLILQIVFLLKKPKSENTATNTNYESNFQHIETYIADEFSRSRKETSESLNSRLSEMNALIREIQQHAAKRKAHHNLDEEYRFTTREQ